MSDGATLYVQKVSKQCKKKGDEIKVDLKTAHDRSNHNTKTKLKL